MYTIIININQIGVNSVNRFKNVGLVLDLSHDNSQAIMHAQQLVKSNKASLVIFCVSTLSISEKETRQIKENLNTTFHDEHQVIFAKENPVVEITKACAQKKIDIILIESTTKTYVNQFFLGSIVLSLLRKAPCPVWVVKKTESKAYQRVLIAVSPTLGDEKSKSLNDKLVEIGTSFAMRQQAECYLLTAWNLPGESTLRSPWMRGIQPDIEEMKMQRKVKHAKAFESLQAKHQAALKFCETFFIEGEPAEVVVNFAAEKKVDILIMGTLARAGITGFVIGNTAENIINQVKCSLIAIKPDDFKSPILYD